jgi:molybdopterin converting factor small subunit
MTEPTRINVGVRAFAALREALGFAETTVSIAPGTDIAGLMARLNELYPRADLAARRYGVALNRSYASLTAVLADGDEVALIPPVSGGAAHGSAAAKLFEISDQPLSLDDVMRRVIAPDRGGVTVFAGTVRGVTRRVGEDEIATDYLEYEAYPEMAEEALARIAAEAQSASCIASAGWQSAIWPWSSRWLRRIGRTRSTPVISPSTGSNRSRRSGKKRSVRMARSGWKGQSRP